MSSTVGYEVRRVQGAAEFRAALELRYEVFCREQGVPEPRSATAATTRRCTWSRSPRGR